MRLRITLTLVLLSACGSSQDGGQEAGDAPDASTAPDSPEHDAIAKDGASSNDGASSVIDSAAPDAPDADAPLGFAVTTNRYDNARSGANLRETALTSANVASAQFGLL